MDRLEIVKKYVEEHPEIDQKKTPNLITYTRGNNKAHGDYVKIHELKSGRIFYNSYKGFDFREHYWPSQYLDFKSISAQNGGVKYGIYMNYVDELNMLEFAIILINIDRANEKLNIDKRKWQATINKYYIFNDEKDAYCAQHGRVTSLAASEGKFYNKAILQELRELGKSIYFTSNVTFQEFNAFIYGTREKHTHPKYCYGWTLSEGYRLLYRKNEDKEEMEYLNKIDKELKDITTYKTVPKKFTVEKHTYTGNIYLDFKSNNFAFYEKDSGNNDVFRLCSGNSVKKQKEYYVKTPKEIKELSGYAVLANVRKEFSIECEPIENCRYIVKKEKIIYATTYNRYYYTVLYGKPLTEEVKMNYLKDCLEGNIDLRYEALMRTQDCGELINIVNLDDMLKEPKFKAYESQIRELNNEGILSIKKLYDMGCFS